MALLIFYLLLALFISFICSVLEAVLLSTPASFVELMRGEGQNAAAERFAKLKANIDRPLSAILSLNTVAHTIGAAGVGAQAAIVWGDAYFGMVSVVLTLLILILSEIIPKTIGARYWRELAMPSGRIIKGMIWVCYPLVILSELITKIISRESSEASVSRDEVSAMVTIGTNEGIFESKEQRIIESFLRLRSTRVDEVLTPRVVAQVAAEDMTLREFYAQESFRPYSRIPVYNDDRENITGYVLRVDVYEQLASDHYDMPLSALRRDIVFTTSSQSLTKLWERLLEAHEHIAIVVDEYGGFEGVVSMEDILECMLGTEIVDEKDTVVDMQQYAKERFSQKIGMMDE